MKALDKLIKVIDEVVDEEGMQEALSCVTSVFVAFVTSTVKHAGGDVTKEIVIDGGTARDITIHPQKEFSHESSTTH